jgi:CBS domain-containing protein
MTTNLELFTIQVTDTIRAAMLKITGNKCRVVVVLDGNKVVGTVSDGDIRRAFLREVLPMAPVEKIMNINCVTTRETDSEKLKDILQRERVTVLPVVNEERELIDIALAYEPFYRQEQDPRDANEEG